MARARRLTPLLCPQVAWRVQRQTTTCKPWHWLVAGQSAHRWIRSELVRAADGLAAGAAGSASASGAWAVAMVGQ